MAQNGRAVDTNPPSTNSPSPADILPPRASKLDLTLWLDESNENMLMVQHLRNGSRYYSLLYTNYRAFKPLLRDDLSSLSSLLRAQNSPPELYEKPDYHVLTACKSWVLMSCGKSPQTDSIFMWNPIAHKIKTLPLFPLHSSIRFYGMGIDPSSGCYKVIRVFESEKILKAEILSVDIGLWKEIPYPHCSRMPINQKPCVSVNGFCYWVAEDLISGGISLLSFDFASEKFSPELIPLPDSNNMGDSCVFALRVYRDSPAVVIAFNYERIGFVESEMNFVGVEIWVWKDSQWSNERSHSVEIRDEIEEIVGVLSMGDMILMDRKGDLLHVSIGSKMVSLGISDVNENVELFPLF